MDVIDGPVYLLPPALDFSNIADGLERELIIFKCTWANKAREYIIGIRGWSEIEASLYPVCSGRH
jgi:hypothetical protein